MCYIYVFTNPLAFINKSAYVRTLLIFIDADLRMLHACASMQRCICIYVRTHRSTTTSDENAAQAYTYVHLFTDALAFSDTRLHSIHRCGPDASEAACTYVCTYVRTFIYVRMYVRIHESMIFLFGCILSYVICICIYVCIRTYVRTYVRT